MSLSLDFSEYLQRQFPDRIKDPVLKMLVETVNGYMDNVTKKLLLESYASKSGPIQDGYYEILRRHILGPFYPGPVYSIAEATVSEAPEPIALSLLNTFEYVREGETEHPKFSVALETSLVPASTNAVSVVEDNGDLWLGFHVADFYLEDQDDALLLYLRQNDAHIVSRLFSISWIPQGETESASFKLSDFTKYETMLSLGESTIPQITENLTSGRYFPFLRSFLRFPLRFLAGAKKEAPVEHYPAGVWFLLKGQGGLRGFLSGQMLLNCFPVWNLIPEREQSARTKIGKDTFRLTIPDPQHDHLFIESVEDEDEQGTIVYHDNRCILDPSHEYQFNFFRDEETGEGTIRLSRPAQGIVRVAYRRYDRRDKWVDLPLETLQPGGLGGNISNITLLQPTRRLSPYCSKEAAESQDMIWERFRSLLASRNRLVTKHDIQNAINEYPFLSRSFTIDTGRISFVNKVGRFEDKITPYTEICIPLGAKHVLEDTDIQFHEKTIQAYLERRLVSGCFVRIKLVQGSHE